MAIAFISAPVLGSNRDLACSAFAAYVCRRSPGEVAPKRSDLIYGFGAECALPLPAPPLAVLWDEVFSRRLSYGERICKAYELNLRLQDLISLLPAELSAREYRHLLEDWVQGRFVQPGAAPAVAMHVSIHRRQDRQQHPVRRRRG
jgi:hypothetical protein